VRRHFHARGLSGRDGPPQELDPHPNPLRARPGARSCAACSRVRVRIVTPRGPPPPLLQPRAPPRARDGRPPSAHCHAFPAGRGAAAPLQAAPISGRTFSCRAQLPHPAPPPLFLTACAAAAARKRTHPRALRRQRRRRRPATGPPKQNGSSPGLRHRTARAPCLPRLLAFPGAVLPSSTPASFTPFARPWFAAPAPRRGIRPPPPPPPPPPPKTPRGARPAGGAAARPTLQEPRRPAQPERAAEPPRAGAPFGSPVTAVRASPTPVLPSLQAPRHSPLLFVSCRQLPPLCAPRPP
jgi:hypothetical protein